MRSAKFLSNLITLLAVLGLAFGQLTFIPVSAAETPQAPTPSGGMVSGNVITPAGIPLPIGTKVRLFDMDGVVLRGEALPDLNDGSYSLISIPNGMYVIKAVVPDSSHLTDSLPKPVSIMNSSLTGVNLALGTAQVRGVVMNPDGSAPAPAEVAVYLGNGQLYQVAHTQTGYFKLGGLLAGGYQLQATPTSDDPYWKSARVPFQVTLGVKQALTVTLTSAQIWGYVQTSQGRGVPLAEVVIGSPLSAAEQIAGPKDTTSPTGYFAIGGLNNGTYRMAAFPPKPTPPGMLASPVITVTLPGASNPYTMTLSVPQKVVTGTVTTNTGLPVSDAVISARRVGMPGEFKAFSDASGLYELDLGPGLWSLTVSPASETAGWTYLAPPQLVYFSLDNKPENRTQNFKVQTADAQVSGAVFMPDGITAPTFTVTVGLHNNEGVGRVIKVAPGVGTFSAAIPSGSYKVDVFAHNPGYIAPLMAPITIPANGVYDTLNVTLLARDAAVSGTITADGVGTAGIPVIAWQNEKPGSLKTLSGPNGAFLLPLAAGSWHIQPAPRQDQPYIYSGPGADVTLTSGQTLSDVNFNLQTANATIQGVVVDDQNIPLSANGWANAFKAGSPAVRNGAPIVNGSFSIQVPAEISGTVYKVSAIMPPGSIYLSSTEKDVTAQVGQTTVVTLTLSKKTAVIGGFLWDPRSSSVVSGVNGKVSAWNGADWAAGPINPGTGAFKLDVAAGLWRLNYTIDPQAGYVKLAEARNLPVAAGQTVAVKLPVAKSDASISGTVYDPDGQALSEAVVWVKGIGPVVNNIWLQTTTDAQGGYRLDLPNGHYRLSAAYNNPGWIAPKEMDVQVGPNEDLTGKNLSFSLPDLTISGTLVVSGTTAGGEVIVWAWSDNGGFVKGRFPVSLTNSEASGAYILNINGNTIWHLGAAFKNGESFWAGRAETVVGAVNVTQDITLTGPHSLPGPVVMTFDASQEQTIALADGTTIFIPAGALPAAGQVTLHIVPISTLPHQKHATVLRYGYAFLATDANGQPIEQHFNQDLAITFAYSLADLQAQRLSEQSIKPAYFSTTTNRWTFPESYVVDTTSKTVTMQIDHFTDFALTGSAGAAIFLPVMVR